MVRIRGHGTGTAVLVRRRAPDESWTNFVPRALVRSVNIQGQMGQMIINERIID